MYEYARVSTTGQTLTTQKALLAKAGVERIYSEKISGVAAKRPELERVLDELEAGDVLVVTKLDRLARSTLDASDHRPDRKGGCRLQVAWRS